MISYYNQITQCYVNYCKSSEGLDDFNVFSSMLKNHWLCFQKQEKLIIEKKQKNWCFENCIK